MVVASGPGFNSISHLNARNMTVGTMHSPHRPHAKPTSIFYDLLPCIIFGVITRREWLDRISDKRELIAKRQLVGIHTIA